MPLSGVASPSRVALSLSSSPDPEFVASGHVVVAVHGLHCRRPGRRLCWEPTARQLKDGAGIESDGATTCRSRRRWYFPSRHSCHNACRFDRQSLAVPKWITSADGRVGVSEIGCKLMDAGARCTSDSFPGAYNMNPCDSPLDGSLAHASSSLSSSDVAV